MIGQPGHRLDVEVVGRLVQHEQVMVADQQSGQRDPAALTPAEVSHRRVQVHAADKVLDHRPGTSVGRPDMIRLAGDDPVPDRIGCLLVVSLTQRADGYRAAANHPALIRRQVTGEQPQQAGLAVAVAAHHADHLAGADSEADLVQQRPGAERKTDSLGVDQIGH
jgi:hypothetical protein